VDLIFLRLLSFSESLEEAKQQEELCKQQIEELRKRKSLKLEEVKWISIL